MTDFGRRAGDMQKSTYDTDESGKVDDAEKLDGSTKAQVQDHTPKSHTHTEAQITDLDHNAQEIKGKTVDDAAIADGKALVYKSASGKIEYETPGGEISGDGTAGRVLRTLYLSIDNGTDADTIKCTTTTYWNGDAISAEDNLAKDGDSGNFALSTNGNQLTIKDSGLTGSCIAVLAIWNANNQTTVPLSFFGYDASGIVIVFRNAETGAAVDLTSLVDTGYIRLQITYLTSS